MEHRAVCLEVREYEKAVRTYIGKSGAGVGDLVGKVVGKGNQDRYIGKSGFGVGGLQMFGVGGSGVGGSGVGGSGVGDLELSGVGGEVVEGRVKTRGIKYIYEIIMHD